jgi:hypothetical protein
VLYKVEGLLYLIIYSCCLFLFLFSVRARKEWLLLYSISIVRIVEFVSSLDKDPVVRGRRRRVGGKY